MTALNAAVDAVGGIRRFVQPGETVTVKPNIGWDRAPEQAATTNPLLVGEMVRLCLAAVGLDSPGFWLLVSGLALSPLLKSPKRSSDVWPGTDRFRAAKQVF